MSPQDLLITPHSFTSPAAALDGLPADQADAKVSGTPHSIVAILAHMLFWQEWFLDRCQGRATPIPETASGGWPGAGAAEWEPLRSRFLANLERAAAIYEAGGDEVIAPAIEIPFMASYTIRDAMTHMAMHNAHHLGQIITLRQIGGSWPPPKGGMTW